jgi:hypothetical protein
MRGVFENPEGSGIWWIHYYAAGKRHREKVGRKSDAIKLYQSRKADAVAGRKLPELRNSKVVTLAELIDDAWNSLPTIRTTAITRAKGPLSVKTWVLALRQS